jgi:hypothetical protein
VPSAFPTRDALSVLTETVASNSIVTTQGGLQTYSIDPVTFTNLAGTGNNWYLTVEIYGTGWGIPSHPEPKRFIGTAQSGPFVWHAFERGDGSEGNP